MERIDWQEARIPRCVAAALDGLRFGEGLRVWPDADPQEWDRTIYYLHRNQLTLILHHVCGGSLPAPVRTQFDAFSGANIVRLAHLREVTREVVTALERAAMEPLLLKGFARASEFVPDPDARMHYDIDVLCPRAHEEAAGVLRAVGYQPISEVESQATGHLPPMARPTSWKWRGDFFDADTAIQVEIHRSLWTSEFEGFSLSGLEGFWTRREYHEGYRTLSRHDALAHRSMHLLRHLLRGDFRAAGVYEIGYFQHENRGDDQFWSNWASLYGSDLQRAQAVCFALARRWFGCELHPIAETAIHRLPDAVRLWMETSAASPAESFFSPGKQELSLHFALVDSAAAKFRIAMRRLLPVSHSPRTWETRAEHIARLRSRVVFHARSLAPTLFRLLMIRR